MMATSVPLELAAHHCDSRVAHFKFILTDGTSVWEMVMGICNVDR